MMKKLKNTICKQVKNSDKSLLEKYNHVSKKCYLITDIRVAGLIAAISCHQCSHIEVTYFF